jgi:DNA polymerase-3 subunit chi
MTDVLFYHLQRQPLEAVLPQLLQRSLARGWRAVVEAGSDDRVAALDDHLWTFSEDSFLPHAAGAAADLADEPIVLTSGPGNPNAAQVRFCVDGAPLPPDPSGYERVVLVFDGRDDEALAAARRAWAATRTAGLVATYWQQNEDGRWEQKA